MFVLTNFLLAVAEIVNAVLSIYWWIVIASAVLSWVNPDPYNPIVRFLRAATEPVMYRIRRVIPLYFGGIDFTPIVVLLLIQFLQIFLVPTLRQLALRVGGQPSGAFLM
ncbi:MAG TPA: YggT family protein [Candidatus Binatia bacterium]|nr:YggT family protein [Candidatus Binatia bacterium]